MKYSISNIDTFIKNKELQVSFFVDDEQWEPFITTSFISVAKNVNSISPFELELLKGQVLEPSRFYKQGEKMPNGRVAHQDKKYPKAYKIAFEGSLEQLRTDREKDLLLFQTIYNVRVSQRNNKSPYVEIKTIDDRYYFSKISVFKSIVGLNEREFGLLTGSYISPVFYKQGDVSQYNGRFVTITESDKIVATFNIRIEGTLDYNFEKNGTPLIEMRSQIDPYRRYDQEDDDDEYGSSYEEYNGYNGWDDDTINDAFEGDPEATWNVD